MSYTPLVSIIIPTYNRANQIVVALNSLMSQSYTNWECLVVDDQSDDNTTYVLKTYQDQDQRFHYLKRDREPKGAPTCRNIGLQHAKGDFVIFLDSDDYLMPFCLKKRIEHFLIDNECDFLIFPMGEQKGNTIKKIEIADYKDYLIPFLSANLPWSIMCPIWKREFLIELNGFTEGYPRFNDPELMIRALLEPNVIFKVFNHLDYDTVFVPNKKNLSVHTQKVYASLRLFIPDIVNRLGDDKKGYTKYLALYLHLWFKYFYIPSNSNDILRSANLINMFKRNKIISSFKYFSLMTRLMIYLVSKWIYKPIDKLSEKAIYLQRH